MKVAGIDVHKKVLMVVVVDASMPEEKPVRRRFVTMPSELRRLLTWLREQEVEEAVMESTAQYGRSVWLELEPHMAWMELDGNRRRVLSYGSISGTSILKNKASGLRPFRTSPNTSANASTARCRPTRTAK